MAGAKKKDKEGKGKKAKRRCLNEKETLSYEQEILENNRQLARLRSRNEELEEETEVAKEKLRQLEEDRSDVIAYLKRSLEVKSQEAKELNERLSELEELRKEELVLYKKKESDMEAEYQLMENTLGAEVKIAAGKLSALEDWRLARLDLMKKFEKQEEEMAEQERRHKEALYEAEKSAVIGKATMQKEMNKRLQILSEQLRKSTTLRMAEIMHRAIRENVALNRELDNLLETNKELEKVNVECKKAEETFRLKCQLFETESKITLKKVLKQRTIMHNMADEFNEVLAYYTNMQMYNSQFAKLQEILDDTLQKIGEKYDNKIQVLKKHIMITMNEKEQLLAEIQEKEKHLKGLKEILSRVRSLFDEALQLTEHAINKQEYMECVGSKLLHSLNEILQTENLIEVIEYTPSEAEAIECNYTVGCLGLIDPTKPSKKRTKGEEDILMQDTKEEISLEDLKQRIPSCLLSDVSSSILLFGEG